MAGVFLAAAIVNAAAAVPGAGLARPDRMLTGEAAGSEPGPTATEGGEADR
jgi:hypothetical protein